VELNEKINAETIDNILHNIRIKTEESKLVKKDTKDNMIFSPPKKNKLIEMKSAKKMKESLDKFPIRTNKILSSPQNYVRSNLMPSMKVNDKENVFFFSENKKLDGSIESKKSGEIDIPKENDENLFDSIKPPETKEKIIVDVNFKNADVDSPKKAKHARVKGTGTESKQSGNVKQNNILTRSISTTNHLLQSININDHVDTVVNDEWVISPLKKSPTKASRMTKENPKKKNSSLHDYRNLKIDKNDVKNTGCCVSCV